MAFTYDPPTSRYRDTATGRLVSRSAVRATLDTVLDVQMARIEALSTALVAGDAQVPAWRAEMAIALKIAHLEGAAVARGGWAQLSQDDFGWIGQRVRQQLGYLDQFQSDLISGQQPMDGRVAARAAMYVEAGRATQREMERRMAGQQDKTIERNVLASGDVCSGCGAATAAGWVPLGTLVPVGSRNCYSRCRCWLIFK